MNELFSDFELIHIAAIVHSFDIKREGDHHLLPPLFLYCKNLAVLRFFYSHRAPYTSP